MSFVTELFNHYGYIILFSALALELIALPTPGETLMTYCGFLAFQGKLNWILSIVVASSGIITGITASYFIGRKLGSSFFSKHGARFHMGPDRLEKTSKWFKKYGNGLLIASYFIPGIRHITGYFCGITKIPFKKFAINAYIGAFLWAGVFISLGKVLGSNWEIFYSSVKQYLVIGGIVAGAILICIYLYRGFKGKIVGSVVNFLKRLLMVYQSFGKIKFVLIVVAAAFIGFSILVIGIIQDFLANEFTQFDKITSYLINKIFTQNWSSTMHFFSLLTTYPILISITILLTVWITIKGKDRFLEFRFLLITILGGEILEELLRLIFHRLGPSGLNIIGLARYTFPSEQTLMAFVTCVFAAFIILRHVKRRWIGIALTFISLIICLLAGLSPLFFKIQYPSDVSAGYVFGGVWLSLNIILLEVFRILPKIKFSKSR